MNKKNRVSRAACVGGLLAMVLSLSPASARSWSFDAEQLEQAGQDMDISVFNQGGQLPGTYLVDVMLNGERVDYREMAFHQETDADNRPVLKTCLSRPQLAGYGIRVEGYPALFPAGTDGECAHLSAIPQATQTLQFNSQQLLLSVPQVALVPVLKGITPQTLWDEGAPVFLMNYQMNATRTEFREGERSVNEAYFARLDPGLNLGAWRLRNMSTWRKTGMQPAKWQTAGTWAERGLYGLKSRLTLGDRYTSSDIFSSVPFRGGMLESDELMVPWSLRQPAPVVRGIARTQARVDVRQGGYVIYSTTVAPGPFALTGLSAGSNGDLLVTVVETDGAPQVFTVPWTAPAIALREGYLKYSLMSGRYRPDDAGVTSSSVVQGTVMYGLPWGLTAYGGLQWSEHYRGTTLGLGMQLGDLGALSVDGSHGLGDLPGGETVNGQTWRLRYNKVLETTGTGISLSSSRYSPAGEVSLGSVLNRWRDDTHSMNFHSRTGWQREARHTLNLSQSLGGLGYISLTGVRETYRNGGVRDELTTSLSSSIRGIGWSVNWTQRQLPQYGDLNGRHGRHEQEASLWVSVPLDRWLGGNTYATYQMQSGSDNRGRHDVGLSGGGFDQQLRWGVRQQYQPGAASGSQYGGLMNMTWNGAYGVVDGSYSYSGSTRQMSAGLSGGVVGHEHGITLGQPLGQTTALVMAPGVTGVGVSGATGVRTDFRGYTTRTGLSAYQENLVELDPASLPADAELPQTAIKVVPTDGAVIPVRFAPRVGGRAVITLHQTDGRPVPFGAMVTLAGDDLQGSGIVGGDGEVYMSGLPEKGTLAVQWSKDRQCRVNYGLPEKKGPAGVYRMSGVCR